MIYPEHWYDLPWFAGTGLEIYQTEEQRKSPPMVMSGGKVDHTQFDHSYPSLQIDH